MHNSFIEPKSVTVTFFKIRNPSPVYDRVRTVSTTPEHHVHISSVQDQF